MEFKIGQVVLFQNVDGIYIGKICELLTDDDEYQFVVENGIEITELFTDNAVVDTMILEDIY